MQITLPPQSMVCKELVQSEVEAMLYKQRTKPLIDAGKVHETSAPDFFEHFGKFLTHSPKL